MKKYFYVLIISICTLSILHSQSIVNVTPGDGTLKQAIASAKDGDILRLTRGAEYSESVELVIPVNKKITIDAEGTDQSQRPKIIITRVPVSPDVTAFFTLGDKSALTLKDLEFDGRNGGIVSASTLIKYNYTAGSAPISVGNIKINNCWVHHLLNHVVDCQQSAYMNNVITDSVFVFNTVINDVGPVIHYKWANVKYIEVKNSTIFKFQIYGIRAEGNNQSGSQPTYFPNVVIDKVTMDNLLSATSAKSFVLAVRQNAKWTVTNSIFSNNGAPTQKGVYFKNDDASLPQILGYVSTSCLWKDGARDFKYASLSDTVTIDPLYKDATNGDFTIPKGSALLTMSSTKGPIGDPRWAVNAPATGVEKLNNKPRTFSLEQNFPNPFNPSTKIQFNLNKNGNVTLSIYNILGKEVIQLVNGYYLSGSYSVDFSKKDLPSGIYLYKIVTNEATLTKKMILSK